MKLILIIVCFHISTAIFGQNKQDSILRTSVRSFISTVNTTTKDSFLIKLDSIEVTINYNSQYVRTRNLFTKSKRQLTIEFYYQNDSLRYIETSEVCLSKPELTCFSYYFIRNTIPYIEHSTSKKVQSGIVNSMEEITKAHFCPDRIDIDFINSYVFSLHNKLNSLLKRK